MNKKLTVLLFLLVLTSYSGTCQINFPDLQFVNLDYSLFDQSILYKYKIRKITCHGILYNGAIDTLQSYQLTLNSNCSPNIEINELNKYIKSESLFIYEEDYVKIKTATTSTNTSKPNFTYNSIKIIQRGQLVKQELYNILPWQAGDPNKTDVHVDSFIYNNKGQVVKCIEYWYGSNSKNNLDSVITKYHYNAEGNLTEKWRRASNTFFSISGRGTGGCVNRYYNRKIYEYNESSDFCVYNANPFVDTVLLEGVDYKVHYIFNRKAFKLISFHKNSKQYFYFYIKQGNVSLEYFNNVIRKTYYFKQSNLPKMISISSSAKEKIVYKFNYKI